MYYWSKFGNLILDRWWMMAIFYFEVKFDLEGQGQSPPKTIGILTKVFYTYGANLVILAWTGVELSRGQASDYRTHRRTDGRTHRQTQATTIPECQNWPRVKRCDRRTDGRTDGWTDRQTDRKYHSYSCLVAAKKIPRHVVKAHGGTPYMKLVSRLCSLAPFSNLL